LEVIKTDSITKRFGHTLASDNISVHVNRGEIYGFLGLNGAGKTTLIRMLLGMIRPDTGMISILGRPLTSAFHLWNEIGYLVEKPYAYPNLSVAENLRVYLKLRMLDDESLIDEVIDKLKLETYRNTKAKVLSLGNQQRLGLAKALMHRPKLLILDEPVNGLDPEAIVEVRQLLKTLSSNGTTIFLSSHILGEISKVVNRIGIIHNGKLIKEVTSKALEDQLVRKLIVVTNNNQTALAHLQRHNYTAALSKTDEIEITDNHALNNPEVISKLLVSYDLPPKQVYQHTEDLEMYFLRTIKSWG
jgi:ABC-2 type transport system ATP-binding protein